MQMTTRYLDKRSYLELALVLAVAIVAAGFGRWVIPSGSEQATSITANASAAVPALVDSNLADLEQAQLDAQDRLVGFGGRMNSDTTSEQATSINANASAAVPALVDSNLADLEQAQLDAQDRLVGVTSP